MRRLASLILVMVLALGAWGCAEAPKNETPAPPPGQGGSPEPSPPPVTQPDPASLGQSLEALGGIRLGMTVAEVEKLLGQQFTEELREEGGYFGESFAIRSYKGCDLVIGKTTGKVLQIDVFAPEYPTEQGVKVGDASIAALEKYRLKYPEWVGNQSPDVLTGWFKTEPDILLIFSSMENRERSNDNLADASKITAITLGYIKFFD